MTGERKVTVKIDGDSKGAEAAFNRTGKSAEGLSKTGIAVGVAVGNALTWAIEKVVQIGPKLVMAGSDLNEIVSKSNTVFKDSAGTINEWAKSSASSFGQSRKEATEAASTFGNLFVQLGTSTEKAAGMSMAMTELASDFASFHNAQPVEVIDAMTAAFRGEYDAVQRFVPTINAAAVEQRALADAHKTSTKELTAQEKALATQKLLLEGAGDAMGDFDRTNDSLANRLRIGQARIGDFSAALGKALLPVALKAFDAIESLGGKAANALRGVDLSGVKEKFTSVLDDVKPDVSKFLNNLRDNIVGGSRTLVDAFTIAADTGDWKSFGAALGSALNEAITGLADSIQTLTESFGELFGRVDWVGIGITLGKYAPALLLGLAAGILNFDLENLLSGLGDHWLDIVLGILTIAFAPVKLIGKVSELLSKVPLVGTLLAWALTHLKSFSDNLLSASVKALDAMWTGFLQGLGHFGEPGAQLARRLNDFVYMVWSKGVDFLAAAKSMIAKVPEGILGALEAIGQSIGLVARRIVDSAAGFGRLLWNAGTIVVRGLIEGLENQFPNISAVIRTIPGRVTGALHDPGGFLRDAGRRIVNGLIDGIQDRLGALAQKANDLARIIRDRLPFSPAKTGPLSGSGSPYIAGQKIASMVGEGMESNAGRVAAAANALAGSAAFGVPTPSVASGGSAASVTHSRSLVIQQLTVVANDPKSLLQQLDEIENLSLPLPA